MNAETPATSGASGAYSPPAASAPQANPGLGPQTAGVFRPQQPTAAPGAAAVSPQANAAGAQPPRPTNPSAQQPVAPSAAQPQRPVAPSAPQPVAPSQAQPINPSAPQPTTPAAPKPTTPAGPTRTPITTGVQPTGTNEAPVRKSRKQALASLAKGSAEQPVAATDSEGKPMKSSKVGGPRKVRVMLHSIDPWSIMKLAFLLAIAAGVMLVVATHIVWSFLNDMGVFTTLQEQITTLFGEEQEVNILQYLDYNKIMSGAVLLAVFNTVILTALGTIGALLYNVTGKLVGGIYVTLTDD